jgi:hypothetical protein
VKALVIMVGLCGLFAAGVACERQGTEIRQEQKPMQEKTIEAVLKEHTDNLMSLPGVVGTAHGLCDGKPCIKVFVREKTAILEEKIPPALEGYPVVVEETGEIQALPEEQE